MRRTKEKSLEVAMTERKRRKWWCWRGEFGGGGGVVAR